MNTPLLRMEKITKAFSGVIACNSVDFELQKGEVNALIGENGAGKSTLMKILTGVYQKDQGKILLNGESININNPIHGQKLGISIIYQEFNLFPHLTVAENIFIKREPKKNFGLVIDDKQMNKDASKAFEKLHLDLEPERKVSGLSIAEQQMLEIVKAISFKSEILIMDEPTAALTDVNSDLPVSFVATNNLNAGAIAADELAALVGEAGTVGIIVHDATSQTGQERRDGFLQQMDAKYPNITVLEPVYGGGAHETSANLITDMVRANPDLLGIFAGNEGSAVGAGIAIKELDRADIALIGFDSGSQQIEFLKEGIIDGFISQDPFNIGYLGVKTLYNAMMGESVEKLYDTGAVFVTIDNLNDEDVQRILYH